MTSTPEDWTDALLDEIQRLDAAGHDPAAIAARIGRDEAGVRDRLRIVRARLGRPRPPRDATLDWHGPDEEGDVPPPSGRADDDPAAWVHSDRD